MLETDRLILRPLDEKDVNAIFAMRSDPEVMRFIREPQNREESANWIELVSSRWATEQIGFCAMVEKPSRKLVGWCGLWRLKETGEIEIGYAVAKEFWGKGYATEAALKFLDYAFEKLEPEKIVAVARAQNMASRRVMEKLGMDFVKTDTFYDQTLVQYAITKENYARNRKAFTA
jgi:ribosomal-protein-alanine N-acetyltransferase